MYVVYAIESCSTARVYIGQTQDMDARLSSHNQGLVASTKKDRPWKLLAIEMFETREGSRWCEHQLKESRGRRLKWIEKHKL
jgi:putative endonuclease